MYKSVLATLVFLWITSVAIFADTEISVTIDGQKVEFGGQQPTIVEDRTLVPVRGVFEQMGFVVTWNRDTRQAVLARDDYTVTLTIGSTIFVINDTTYNLDVPAQIIGDSTMVPLRAILEGVGYTLGWSRGAVTIMSPIREIPPYITIRGETFPTDLRHLNLINRNLTNACIVPLRYMFYLEELNLGLNPAISDLSPLYGRTNITKIVLGMNQISDITPLASLPYLNWLHLDFNPLSDISPLAGLVNLEQLILFNNQIEDISPLAGLTNLNRLVLFGNEIVDLSPLAGLTNLTILGLSNNNITDVAPLAGLYNLVELGLNGNDIADLSPLDGLENLESLYLD